MDATLQDIKKYAGLTFTVPEIAFRCGLDENAFRAQIRHKKGEMYAAYMDGRLETKEKVNTQIIEMAAAGSPQAEALLIEHLDNQKRNE